MSAVKCPVCEGRTTMPMKFYYPACEVDATERCRSCDGKGYVTDGMASVAPTFPWPVYPPTVVPDWTWRPYDGPTWVV